MEHNKGIVKPKPFFKKNINLKPSNSMKKLTLIMILCSFVLTGNLSAQIKVNSSGYVGINNTNPTYRLDVVGTVKMTNNSNSAAFDGYAFYPSVGTPTLGTYSYPWYQLYAAQAYFFSDPVIMSDINLKTNIKNITSVKDKVQLLRPVTYNFKSDNNMYKYQTYNNLQYGFIAQEVEEIFPDLVIKMEDGNLAVRYTGLVPVLIQALKEQQSEIDALTKRVSDLESKVK